MPQVRLVRAVSARARLQLEEFRLQGLHIEFNEDWFTREAIGSDRMEDYAVDPHVEILRRADEDTENGTEQLMVRLSIHCEPVDEQRLTRFKLIQTEVWGIFSIAEDTPEEHVEQFRLWNSVAILHGVARGQIMQATGTCYEGPFILPSLNYLAEASQEGGEGAEVDDNECLPPEPIPQEE